MAKKGTAIFCTGNPSRKVVEELQRAVAANTEEVAVGTDPNIVGFHMTSLKFKLQNYRVY